MSYKMKDNQGETFEMGASIDEVGRGDAVKVNGRLERIAGIEKAPGSKWDRSIITESGRTYRMLDIQAYGKKSD